MRERLQIRKRVLNNFYRFHRFFSLILNIYFNFSSNYPTNWTIWKGCKKQKTSQTTNTKRSKRNKPRLKKPIILAQNFSFSAFFFYLQQGTRQLTKSFTICTNHLFLIFTNKLLLKWIMVLLFLFCYIPESFL